MRKLLTLSALLLLASAAHAQSFTLKLHSCTPKPSGTAAFYPDANGGGVWGYLQTGNVWPCTINVPQAGDYTVSVSVASPWTGAALHFESPAGTKLGGFTVSATGTGWSTYKLVTTKVTLPAGQVPFLLVLDVYGTNLDDTLTFTSLAAAPQPVNLTLSGTLLWDDGTPIQGKVQVQEQRAPDTVWYVLKDLIPDGSGNVSDTVSISTNFADNLQFLFIILDATGKVTQGVLEEPAAGGMFQKIRSVSGFKIIVDKASCAGTQCVLAPGSMPGTLGP